MTKSDNRPRPRVPGPCLNAARARPLKSYLDRDTRHASGKNFERLAQPRTVRSVLVEHRVGVGGIEDLEHALILDPSHPEGFLEREIELIPAIDDSRSRSGEMTVTDWVCPPGNCADGTT